MNKEVERYIAEERENGIHEETIRNALLAKGWEYQMVETALAASRPGPVTALFTREFFRFAFGFIAIIMVSVLAILITGAMSDSHQDESHMTAGR